MYRLETLMPPAVVTHRLLAVGQSLSFLKEHCPHAELVLRKCEGLLVNNDRPYVASHCSLLLFSTASVTAT
jgi:hypothetical protein